MNLEGKTIGFGITGSFCTFDKVFTEIKHLVDCKANVIPIFSYASQSTDTRFGEAKKFLEDAKEITGNKPILTIKEAEPIGPKELLDIMLVAPCTGNTIAKLANAITDTSVTMAVKAHLRNNKPVVIAVSSNDALGANLKNIGVLANSKSIFLVPFGQDNYMKKPNSLVAHMNLIVPTLEAALDGIQIQPMIQNW